jgi:hypothetical protein
MTGIAITVLTVFYSYMQHPHKLELEYAVDPFF